MAATTDPATRPTTSPITAPALAPEPPKPLAWGPNDQHRLLNTRLPRVDFPKKTTGAAIYSYDVHLPGMLYGRILRSPYAHAKITGLDLTAAKKIPGVKAVIGRVGVGATLRFEGDPIAAVAAITQKLPKMRFMRST
jgi:xanthine dehydrogenase YagR molybdenum-binding subunit